MNIKEITTIFSNKVTEYLNSGWVINAQTMTGWSSNEITKVDLTNGSDILRVMMESDSEFYDFDEYNEYIKRIEINLYREARNDSKPFTRIIFPKWELVETRAFYALDESWDGEWYVEDFAEVVAAKKKHRARQRARFFIPRDSFCEFPITVNMLPLVRRFPKCKTAHLEDIEKITRDIYGDKRRYNFFVKGKCHTIMIPLSNHAE